LVQIIDTRRIRPRLPLSTSLFIFRMIPRVRIWSIEPRATFRLRHSSTMARAAPIVTAIGFSHRTCSPQRAARMVSGGCR